MHDGILLLILAYIVCTFIALGVYFEPSVNKDFGFVVWWPIYLLRYLVRTFIEAWVK